MFPIASWSLTTQLQTEVFPEAEAGGPQVATYPPRHQVKVKDAPGGADLELATARKATCGEREDQTGARGLVHRETGVWVLQIILFRCCCALISRCCFSGFSTLSTTAAANSLHPLAWIVKQSVPSAQPGASFTLQMRPFTFVPLHPAAPFRATEKVNWERQP